jgi:hypothetical protein
VKRSKKLGLTILSLMLWAQLIFSIGITAWRYWLVSTAEAELFVDVSSHRVEPMLIEVENSCPADATLLYIGERPSYDFARYELFPRKLPLIKPIPGDVYNQQLEAMIVDRADQIDGIKCLIVDIKNLELTLPGDSFAVEGGRTLFVVR